MKYQSRTSRTSTHRGREFVFPASLEFISFPGAGGNDFCPILRLSEENGLAFPRKGYALVKHIKKHEKNDIKIKPNIHEWDTLETITNVIANFLLET